MNQTLEIFGQVRLNIYTQICLCYARSSSKEDIVETLQAGLLKLTESFPWIAGQVVKRPSGLFEISEYEKTPVLTVRDNSMSFERLREAQFPFRMLDEADLAPRRTTPRANDTVFPVFMVQATFVEGGLLLTFLGHHQVMDGTGQAQLMSLLSKACNKEPFTEEELTVGNSQRENIVSLFSDAELKNYGDLQEKLSHQILIPSTDSAVIPTKYPSWKYFNFSKESLKQLKSQASQNLKTPFVSTDDTLTAFVWQAVSRARLQRLPGDRKSTLGRAVNVRSCLDISESQPGNLTNMAYGQSTLEELSAAPLGHVASLLRSKLDSTELQKDTRALATLIHSSRESVHTSPTASIDVSSDILLSSWAQQNSYELDFGLGLGYPECVRRPQFTPCESLMYLLPKSREGDIALAICVHDEDMEALRRDPEFSRFSTYIE
ncbi:Trichothecene 3-O-acetyltransferase [Yarrowia sp. B02]|nr:Trichothecene 3-O-acetyltransferase [Yarrowia sp. B02]